MSLRAVWIVSAKSDLPIYSRYFPSVEARSRSTLGNLFVKIPPEREFVKELLIEVGLREGGTFVESRDNCDKQVVYPAFHLKTEHGILWPVVIMECKGFILCALPHDDNNPKIIPPICQVSLSHMPSIALALEVLNGLAECILNSKNSSAEGNLPMTEVIQYVNVSLPFGRPISCDISVCGQLGSVVKGKAKVPTWNPMPHKGKSQVVLHIKEEVRSTQFNHLEMKDSVDVFGTVMCRAEVEGNAPEISLGLIQSAGGNGSGLVVNPGVCNVENLSQTSFRLRFYPSNSQPLCHYSLPLITDPPIFGAFSIKVLFKIADFTYSGTKIDPQSIVVSTAAKVRCSVSSEFVSKVYKLWNSEGEVPVPASIFAEDLKVLLKQS
ncbi:AP-5 complex subunit mu-1 isoform X2 [Anabrus simplex]|uniref:AP-5 complex subunit mu-1 isoform X2 n=1 Tax=Anabrus simplex TaxID=316456 RepID=UPI0035A2CDEB